MKRNKDTVVKRMIRVDNAELRVREADGDAPSRTITGYAILFNTPSVPLWSDEDSEAREVIAPEAITKELLDGCDIKFTMFHDRQIILGRSNKGSGTLEYFVDEKGVGFNLELTSRRPWNWCAAVIFRVAASLSPPITGTVISLSVQQKMSTAL